MPQQKKFLATGFLILAILIVMFLASGISSVEFQPGAPVVRENAEFEFRPLPQSEGNQIWRTVLMILLSIILPISIVMFIKYPEVRRRTYQGLTYFLIYGLLLFASMGKSQEDAPVNEEIEQELVDTSIIETQREAAEFINSVAEPSPELNIIIDIAIVLVVGLLIGYIYWRFFRQQPSTTDQIRAEAEEAISELQAGESLRNVIIRCYVDMSQVLNEQRGIQRKKAMTPREFEQQLQAAGLPGTEVRRLTRLFEEVRYGHVDLNRDAEQEAIQCLMSIAEAC